MQRAAGAAEAVVSGVAHVAFPADTHCKEIGKKGHTLTNLTHAP